MEKPVIFDLRNLLLPLGDRVGAIQKVNLLIEELQHPNIDWKSVVAELRTYLFDYIYEIVPFGDKVLPVIFFYIYEATVRKKASAIRASDTFFNRYAFLLKNAENNRFIEIIPAFEEFSGKYFDLMISESRDGFFFGTVNNKVVDIGEILLNTKKGDKSLIAKINEFLYLQYKIYTKNIIKSTDHEIKRIEEFLGENEAAKRIIEMLKSVSEDSYNERINAVHLKKEDPEEVFNTAEEMFDFSHNSGVWEKLCIAVRRSIEDNSIDKDSSKLRILSYLVEKSNEGNDRELQLFMSRTVASVCSAFVKEDKADLLKNIIDMVMPVLLDEIEKERNYFSAFSTIYNIGKTVVESKRILIIDYFIEILIKSKFCFPSFSGIASDWSVIVNFSHIENIRTWMKLIELNPPLMRKLAASLIVNLKLGGVFLKDTDVFQRDISRLLNSNYGDVFYLITSLAAVFPAFYHDIGATGDIRAFTERIDTNHQMNDLIHFLRKQVHVESSSRTVFLIQRVMEYWMTGDKRLLNNLVPKEVYDNLDNFFRLVNLDIEDAADMIYKKALEEFKEHSGERFWDFLNSVEEERFIEFVKKNDFEGVSEEEKEEILTYFIQYYKTKIPTEMTKMLQYIKNMFGVDISKTKIWKLLYEISDDDFRKMFEVVRRCDISKINIEKFITFLHVYRMLFDKYNFSDVRAIEKLEQYAREDLFEAPPEFFGLLKSGNLITALDELLNLQYSLKKDVLLSEKVYEPLDTIEFKRHIAFGIPSMYGSYKEKKFDTLKVFFQMNLIRLRIFEKIVEKHYHDLPGSGFGKIDYDILKKVIRLFIRTFLIDGLANQEMIVINNLLDTPRMRLTQLRDIVNHLITVHGDVSDRFNKIFKHVCIEGINNIGINRIIEKFHPDDKPQSIDIIVDRFMRDQIMQSPLLQLFDNLIIGIRDHINAEIAENGDPVCLNKGKRKKFRQGIIHQFKTLPEKIDENKTFLPVWDTGSKAYGLIFARNMGISNVPDGFILSPDLYDLINEYSFNNQRFREKLLLHLKEYVDEFTNNRFANPENPVLLSVRSGAAFSMPGVMDTITNVGLTDEVLEYYAEIDKWFAYDCYRRLIQDLSISFNGIDRRLFENLMKETKEEAGVTLKENLTGEQMKRLCDKYNSCINDYAFSIPKNPYIQLLYAIISVFRSWDSTIAKNYRKFVHISDAWGTSVVVQEMVFGNINPMSLTGVAHSLYIGDENIGLFGEYKTRAQGYDIVSGVAKVFPISEEQKKIQPKFKEYPSLELRFPPIYRKLFDLVMDIKNKWRNDVEIEFTVENGKIYVLQIRGIAKNIFEVEELVEEPEELFRYLLGQGLAASGGAISGRAVFDIERIDYVRNKYKDDKIILIRPETNPEDVIGLKKSDGILTCVGGMTSHAVLQMRRLEKSGVSDFSIMKIDQERNIAVVKSDSPDEDFIINEGDFITIDGNTGNVYRGFHKTRKKTI